MVTKIQIADLKGDTGPIDPRSLIDARREGGNVILERIDAPDIDLGDFTGPAGPNTVPTAAAITAAVSPGGGSFGTLANNYGTEVSVLAFGALGDGATADTAAIDAALASLSGGGTLRFPGSGFGAAAARTYVTAGGHVVPKGVTIDARGAIISHTGDNVCFNLNFAGTFNNDRGGGVLGLTLKGNAGVAAVGVEFGNAWGLFLRNGDIQGYTSGVGLKLSNVRNWCEGTQIDGLKMDYNKVGVQFARSTGTSSFAYTRINDLSINVRSNCTGIDLGSTAASTMYMYNSSIRAAIWILGLASVGVLVGANFTSDNNHYEITGEIPGNAGDTTGASGLKNAGGRFYGFGHVNVKSVANDLVAGTTRVLTNGVLQDTRLGTNGGGDTFRGALSSNIDNPHDAQFGYISGTNRSIPYVLGYDQSDAFRVYKAATGQTPATGTELFRVRNDGGLAFGSGVPGRLHAGPGAPTVSAGFGAVYFRTDDPAGLPLVYIKLTGSGSSGWAPLDVRRADTTANRPTLTAGQQRGYQFYDTTLSKPIWWNGTAWTDAMGTAV